MIPICVALLLLVFFRQSACGAARAAVDGLFGAARLLEQYLGIALQCVTGWLRWPGPDDPVKSLVGLFLVALAGAVAFADYVVLLASLGLIWPTDVPPVWLAFSVVAVTAAVGMLTHSVNGLLARIVLMVLASLLIGAQGTVAYVRTAQLASIRSIVELSPADDDEGKLVIAAGRGAQSPMAANQQAVDPPTVPGKPDRLGPAMAAGIATILCLSQIAAAWGAISFAGGALTWVVSLPALLSLVIPWLALRVLSASALREGFEVVLEAFFAVLELFAQIPAKIAPFPWTEASLRRRLDRKRRVRLAELQEREDSDAGILRASIEEKLRHTEDNALQEFIVEYAGQRRIMLHDLLQEAFKSARGNLQDLPDLIVRMWFWPLDKVWHLMSVVRGDAQLPPRRGSKERSEHR